MNMRIKSNRPGEETFSIGQAAKLVRFPGGRQKFYSWLRHKNYILKDNFPSQAMVERGWFKLPKPIVDEENIIQVKAVPRITKRGIVGLDQIVTKEFPICKPCKEQANDKQ